MDALLERARRIRLLVLDVDGVLTDGRIYMSAVGRGAQGLSRARRLRDRGAAARRRDRRDHLGPRLGGRDAGAPPNSASVTSARAWATRRRARCAHERNSASRPGGDRLRRRRHAGPADARRPPASPSPWPTHTAALGPAAHWVTSAARRPWRGARSMRPAHQRARALTERLVAAGGRHRGARAALRSVRRLGRIGRRAPDRRPRSAAISRPTRRMTEMGADGRPRFIVHAREIEQQLSDQSVLVHRRRARLPGEEPRQLARDGATRPHAAGPQDAAARGRRHDHRRRGPRRRASSAPTRSPTTSTTASSRLRNRSRFAFGDHEMNARGLRAMLNAGTLRLESDVNGRFTP